MLHTELDLTTDSTAESFDKWLFENSSEDLPEDLGVKYEPTTQKQVKQEMLIVPQNRVCTVCGNSLAADASIQRKTCGAECNKKYRRIYMQQHRSARFPYSCIRCKKNFEVGFSMWDEVKQRGMTCAVCHAATAPDRGLILSDNRSFKIQQPPCRNCVNGYAESSAYSGYACRLNARVCVPHIHAKLFTAREEVKKGKN